MSVSPNPDLIVVGAGPVGLIAGCELARRGLRIRVIDKLAEPTNQSRGRVVIRPDGYVGAVAALDDTTTVADYFAKIRS
ncbi:MAG TPA: FAD-dependent monooxygenase [Mycobacterium sp.]|jgi:2-polyprenyl-6-methoxyphenol hydroxylase-like FAD-dependent oxidoreductase|nr:FAD-dependent monooxygenase [Mycobacterium sp.]